MSTRQRHYLGEDIPLIADFEDSSETATDPDDTDTDGTPDATITITAPDDTDVISAVAMDNPSTGRMEYVWDTSTDAAGTGTYTWTVEAEFNGETKIVESSLTLR